MESIGSKEVPVEVQYESLDSEKNESLGLIMRFMTII
jgi:hypothetical protein